MKESRGRQDKQEGCPLPFVGVYKVLFSANTLTQNVSACMCLCVFVCMWLFQNKLLQANQTRGCV